MSAAAVVDAAPRWEPNRGPQARFLSSGAYEALYGGAAGGGKSEALLMGALRHIDKATYRALLLRRTFPELKRSLIERARQWYEIAGGSYNETDHIWRFASGACIEFGHLEHDHDVHKYQSAEYQYIGFDELTSFTEKQYRYMLSRARSSSGIPVRIRAATNPGGEGHDWVRARWAPWLDRRDDYKGPRADAGQVLAYRNEDEGEAYVERGALHALTRVFVPAKVQDNPHLAESDPAYIERLKGLDPVTRRQLLDGDWLAVAAPGAYFQRGWFDFVDEEPAKGLATFARHWDMAGSIADAADFTAGLKLARSSDGIYTICDYDEFKGKPGEVEARMKATAAMDGRHVAITFGKDPGQAGIAQSDYLVKQLAGYDVEAVRETGGKEERAKPVSAQVFARNFRMVKGAWNERLIRTLEAFPTPGVHDDAVDALSGAFERLQRGNFGYRDALRKYSMGAR